MNTTTFSNAVGTPVDQIINNIPQEWHKVFSDRYVYVYRNNTVDAFAIFATDDDNIIRFCDVKKKDSTGEYKSIWLYNGIYQNLNTLDDIKVIHDIKRIVEKNSKAPLHFCTQLDMKTAERNVIRKYRNKPVYDSVPILNDVKEWRTVSTDNGETCTDFIIIPDKWGELWGTDDEQEIYDDIEDFVFSTVGCYSAYDFPTGRMITLRWSFKRIPCGVAIIHERGIDW